MYLEPSSYQNHQLHSQNKVNNTSLQRGLNFASKIWRSAHHKYSTNYVHDLHIFLAWWKNKALKYNIHNILLNKQKENISLVNKKLVNFNIDTSQCQINRYEHVQTWMNCAQSCFMVLQRGTTSNFFKYSLGKIATYEV